MIYNDLNSFLRRIPTYELKNLFILKLNFVSRKKKKKEMVNNESRSRLKTLSNICWHIRIVMANNKFLRVLKESQYISRYMYVCTRHYKM